MHTDNAGVAPVRYTPGEHAPWERRAPARWAQSPGSTPDEPILVPPGNTPGWRAPARRRMHTDNAGVAPVRYTPKEHAPRERRAPARWAQSPAAQRTSQCSSLPGIPRVGEHPLADVCTPTTQA